MGQNDRVAWMNSQASRLPRSVEFKVTERHNGMFDDRKSRSKDASKLNVIISDLDDVEELVRTYRSSILRYALASLKDKDLAETVTQDCFLKAFNARSWYRGECSVRTWLFAIAKNLIRDHTRSRRFQFWKEVNASVVNLGEIENRMAGDQRSPEAYLLMREELGQVWSGVNELSEKQRAVFILRFEEEMELSEIALATGMKISTVKSQLYRAVGSIRDGMERSALSAGTARKDRGIYGSRLFSAELESQTIQAIDMSRLSRGIAQTEPN
jgi:RNA polymerase sigma-70 factor (ECF subfamily)